MARVAETPQQSTRCSRPRRPTPASPAEAPPPSRRGVPPPVPPRRPPRMRDRPGRTRRTRPPDNRPGAGLAAGPDVAAGWWPARWRWSRCWPSAALGVRNAQLDAERDAQIAQAQSLENLLDQFDRPGVQHALLAREDGSTIAAVVVENGRPQVFPIGLPANAVDRDTYVLWGIADGANPAPLGTFDVTGDDQGLLAVGSAPDPSELRRLRDLPRAWADRAGRADRRSWRSVAVTAVTGGPGLGAGPAGCCRVLLLRAISSGGERFVHTEEVTGSIPVSPTCRSEALSEIIGGGLSHVGPLLRDHLNDLSLRTREDAIYGCCAVVEDGRICLR